MAVSGNPTLPIERKGADGRIRIALAWRGVILAGLGFSLFVVGLWRVDGVMAAMGLCVVALFLVVFFLGWMNLRSLTLAYLGPSRVESGKAFSAKLMLKNGSGFIDGLWVEMGLELMGETDVSGKAFWVAGGSYGELEARPVLRTRGLQMVQRGWVRSAFPLDLMTFSKTQSVVAEIGVLPKGLVPRTLALSGYLLDGAPLGGSMQFGGIGEWKGLRERRSGDGLRRIAWATSMRSEAAGGGMMVREDEPPGSQAEACLVVFHSYGGDGDLIRPDRFEKALSLLCGVLSKLLECGVPVRWIADFNNWEEISVKNRRQWAAVREGLLEVKRASGTEAHDFIAAMNRAYDHECVVVISDMPRSGWQAFVPQAAITPVLVDICDYDGSRKKTTMRRGGRSR
jgi:uncharacterized protein (DUF58 family)